MPIDTPRRHIIASDGFHCRDCGALIPDRYRLGVAKIVCSREGGLWFPGNAPEARQCTQG